jgi:zinc-ribbon domain
MGSVAAAPNIGPIEVLFLVVLFALPIYVGYRIGLPRGHEVLGLVLGLLFSWVGVLIVWAFPRKVAGSTPAAASSRPSAARFCTDCGSPLAADARFCGSCGAQQQPSL